MASTSWASEELEAIKRKLSEQAHALIRSGTRWHTTAEIARLASVAEGDIASWLREARIFAFEQDGQLVFPEYAFDPAWRPLPALEVVLAIYEGRAGLLMAAWFESRSSFLEGQRPRELLASEPARVIAAAKSAVESEKFPS